ncbi:Rv3654c family TadE-like protein, partial [Amycolatopsis sp. NPDC003676]
RPARRSAPPSAPARPTCGAPTPRSALVIGQVGVVVVARHRAQAAADLGALGAASVLAEGAEAACAEAAEVGRRMGARVARCVVEQWDVVVVVEANATFGVFGVHVIAAAARAGPVDESV